MPPNLENSAVATGLEKSVFIPLPKKGNGKECSNYRTIALISHASKVMLKILQSRLQQYVNRELPDVQAGFRKGRGTRDQTANICWIMEKAREFQKNIYFFIDYAKAFDCVDHNKLWKILKEMGIPDNLTGLLRNLYAGQEATVRTRHGLWELAMDREAWHAVVHRVTKSRTRLSDRTELIYIYTHTDTHTHTHTDIYIYLQQCIRCRKADPTTGLSPLKQ